MRHLTFLLVAVMVLISGSVLAENTRSSYAQLEAKAGKGFLGKEDSVDLGTAKVYFTAPKGWAKEANVDVQNGQFYCFLRYSWESAKHSADILVEGINVTPEDKDVLAYTKNTVKILKEKSADKISEPQALKMNDVDAAYFERTSDKDNFFWARYQFLIGGKVLKLQLVESQGTHEKDLALLKKLAQSIRVEKK